MIPLRKLAELPPRQRARKAFLLLEGFAREGLPAGYPLAELLALAASTEGLAAAFPARFAAHAALAGSDPARAIVRARDDLRLELGIGYADWDLPEGEAPAPAPFPGLAAYLDDVRSPFNVGSVFRAAECFGVERLYLSAWTADPAHPRALRTARGCSARLPWERRAFGDLPSGDPLVVLELGGVPIGDFEFPRRGIAVVGSEELGVSPEILADPRARRVSIPMSGPKASLNLSVAFGILLQRWHEALARGMGAQ